MTGCRHVSRPDAWDGIRCGLSDAELSTLTPWTAGMWAHARTRLAEAGIGSCAIGAVLETARATGTLPAAAALLVINSLGAFGPSAQAAPSSCGEAARRGGRWLLAVVLILTLAAGLVGLLLLGERMRCDRLAATGSGALQQQYGCEAGR